MKLRKYTAVLLGLLLMCQLPCGQAAEKALELQPSSLLSKVNKVVQVKPNQVTFSVTLSANPTTGYNWYLLHSPSQFLVPISAKFTSPKNKKMMGAPGSMTWTFRAEPTAFAVPRILTVELAYARSWDLSSASVYKVAVVTLPSS